MTDEPTAHAHAGRGLRRGLLTQQILLFTLAALVLVTLWLGIFDLIGRERADADRNARSLVHDAADTYEAQVVRSMREIDHALRLVAYMTSRSSATEALTQLEARELLPPSLIFRIDIYSAQGELLASNRALDGPGSPTELLAQALRDDGIMLDSPVLAGDVWQLRFARALERDAAGNSGIVTLTLPAHFFVSGYDERSLGERGLLALATRDGNLLVWRSNDAVSTGGRIAYHPAPFETEKSVLHRGPDGELRYAFVREIFGYPLTILVGLAKDEQLAPAAAAAHNYRMQAAATSVGLVLFFGLVGWFGRRLHQAQQRVIGERAEHAQQVEYLAFHDSLTELPNRALFSRLLAQELRHSKRNQRRLALLFLDLDRFKLINDSLGHDAGDELLREVARRLRAAIRESDTVARLGGDEFVVLLPEIDSADQVAAVAEKVLSQVARPFELAGQEFRVTVSIGATTYPDDGEDEQALMKNADRAMYHAKELGKNNFQYFSAELRNDSLEQLTLESSRSPDSTKSTDSTDSTGDTLPPPLPLSRPGGRR